MKKFLKFQLVDGVHGIIFPKHNPEALMRAFSILISNGKLSKFAQAVAISGRLLAKNMLASECIIGYAKLLENVVNFPSDALLPGPISQLQQNAWEWSLFRKEIEQSTSDMSNIDVKNTSMRKYSVVYYFEEDLTNLVDSKNISENETGIMAQDIPTELDWDILTEIEISEDFERRELEEVWCFCNYITFLGLLPLPTFFLFIYFSFIFGEDS